MVLKFTINKLQKIIYHWLYFWHKIYALWLQLISPKQQNGKLALHLMFKNEAGFLKEWLDFHFAHGVDFIRLTNDGSEDDFQSVLEPYRQRGLLEWGDSINHPDFYKREEYHKNKAMRNLEKNFQWIAFIDSDEYIFPLPGDDLKTHLPKSEKCGGLVLNWLMYGTAHVEKIEEGEFLIDKLNRRFPNLYAENYTVKTIVQSGYGAHFFNKNPHFPLYSPYAPLRWQDGQKFSPSEKRLVLEPLHIKHYWYRSEKFFREVKRARRIFFEGAERSEILERWHYERSNAVYDPLDPIYQESIIAWRGGQKS